MWGVASRKISDQQGMEALVQWREGSPNPEIVARAVRYSLHLLKTQAPGQSVEVRVPPYGAVQVIPGPSHTRGTPPAVVEMAPDVWLEIATGLRDFDQGVLSGDVKASGTRSNLSAWLPIVSVP